MRGWREDQPVKSKVPRNMICMKKPVSSSSLRAKVGCQGWALLVHSPDLAMLPLDRGNNNNIAPIL